MMCQQCVTAGELNAWAVDQKTFSFWKQSIILAHQNCQYPKSCTCQHRIGNNNHAGVSKAEGSSESTGQAGETSLSLGSITGENQSS